MAAFFNKDDKKNGNGNVATAEVGAEGAEGAKGTEGTAPEGLDVYDINPDNVNTFTKALLAGLDKAVAVQTSVITKYVEGLRKRNPGSSPAQLQALVDKHFLNIVSGTGAAAGASSAIPGVGMVTGVAAVGAESVVFLESAAWYILSSAYLRGDNISDEERRRALVLLVLTGSKGTAVVDTLVGDLGTVSGVTSAATLSRFSAPTLNGLNGRLTKLFTKQITKRLKWAWVSKLMPMGIGAVLGTSANRKLAKKVMEHTREQLSPLPAA